MDQDYLEHILTISRRMAKIRTLEPLLKYVVDEAVNLVGAERGCTVLARPNAALDFTVSSNQTGRESAYAEDQISTSVLNQVIESGQPLVLRDAMNNPDFSGAKSVVGLKLRSIMCVPLIAGGNTLGAVYVENRSVTGRFSEDDLPPLILFANQAAVAIENAVLNDELEQRVAARTVELEQARQQSEKSWAEAVEANRMRTVWLSNVAHDMRASLGIVHTTLSVLKEGNFGRLNEIQLKWTGKSLGAVEHTLTLINNLTDLFKLEAGRITLCREPVALEAFLYTIFDVSTGLSWPKTVTFDIDIDSPLPEVYIDPVRMRQVLLNLLSNAHKFTSHGRVTLHARHLVERHQVLVGVADTGEGIPPEKLHLVFERFQQLDDNPDRRRQGSGLGLAICRELVEMHGGQIWVESTPGKGSDFKFTLPVNSSAPPGDED